MISSPSWNAVIWEMTASGLELELMGVTLELELCWRSYEDKPVSPVPAEMLQNPFRVRVAGGAVWHSGRGGDCGV